MVADHDDENNGESHGTFPLCPHADGVEWREHLSDFKRWAETTIKLSDTVSNMEQDTKNLRCLPDLATAIKELNKTLLERATSRSFVPLPVALALVLIFGVYMLVNELGQRDFELTPGKISIQQGGAHAATP